MKTLQQIVDEFDELLPKLDYLHTFLLVKEKIEEAFNLGKQTEKSEISEAVKRLHHISGTKIVDEDMINIASIYAKGMEEKHRSGYIRSLEERLDYEKTKNKEVIEFIKSKRKLALHRGEKDSRSKCNQCIKADSYNQALKDIESLIKQRLN